MALNFPSNPSINDTYVVNGVTYTWDGVTWSSTVIPSVLGSENDDKHKILWIDIDGTVLKEEFVDTNENGTHPNDPDRTSEGLTFVEWTRNADNVYCERHIGACYRATDNKTHLFLDFSNEDDAVLDLYFHKSDTSELSFDWGDGSPISTVTANEESHLIHTYPTQGQYELTIWISSGTGTWCPGESYTNKIFTAPKYKVVYKAYLGADIYCPFTYRVFYNNAVLNCIVIPKEIGVIPEYLVTNNKGLKAIIIPPGLSNQTRNDCFGGCNNVSYICLPEDVEISCDSFLRNINSLEVFIAPKGMKLNSGTNRSRWTFQGQSVKKIILEDGVINNGQYTDTFSWGGAFEEFHCYCSRFGNHGYGAGTLQNKLVYYLHEGCTYISEYISFVATYDNPKAMVIDKTSGIITMSGAERFIDLFIDKYPIFRFYVPDNMVDDYKAATNWTIYSDYILPLSQFEQGGE